MTKGAVARLESTALLKASDWARQWPARPISDAERARLRATLQSTGLDFIQLYRRDGGRWRRVEQLLPEVAHDALAEQRREHRLAIGAAEADDQ